jgi:hypothetical protein
MDTNITRVKKKREWAKYKKAFDEIIGDPFAPEPIDGVYNTLHSSSSISSIEGSFGEAEGTIDTSKPTVLDFFCDVDNALSACIHDSLTMDKFVWTYVFGVTDNPTHTLPKGLRNQLEQQIGKLLLMRGISPVKRYFTVTKGK